MTSGYSLKRRLLKWISIPVLIAASLIFVIAYLFSWHEIEEVYDTQLVHSAKTLLQLTENDVIGRKKVNIGLENSSLQHRYEHKTAFRIWKDDAIILESAKAKDFSAVEAPPGFSDQTIKDKPWRFFVFVDADKNMKIETAERYAIRYELIGQLMMSLAIPMAILLPLLLFIVWIGVRQSITPLVALSSEVDRRKIDDLNPIKKNDIPREVSPLIDAMNSLFSRIGDSFRREREFTDHAAHELRTPLAAMKTQTQVLLKKTSAFSECRDGLENLNATIDRTTHLAEQLLSLARLQNDTPILEPVSLSAIVDEVVEQMRGAAAQKKQTLITDIAPGIIVSGHSDSLFILIRNILDNAIKYTPVEGRISLELEGRTITVADGGPGVLDAHKEKVFNRFVRLDKTGQVGSGLGLSIAQWIADAHQARIVLKDNPGGGLRVEIRFEEGEKK